MKDVGFSYCPAVIARFECRYCQRDKHDLCDGHGCGCEDCYG